MTHEVLGTRRGVLTAQIALSLVGMLWLVGGLFLYGFISPKRHEDGTYWDLIDPVSVERAGELRRESIVILVMAIAVGVIHFAVAALCWRRAWGRWVIGIVGSLYCIAAVPLAVYAVRDVSSALPIYTAIAAVLGVILLNGSRRRSTA